MPDSAAVAGLGVGVLVVCLLSATGALIAATLGIRGRADAFLTAYVAAFAAIIALSLFLSPFGDLKRGELIGGTVALSVAA